MFKWMRAIHFPYDMTQKENEQGTLQSKQSWHISIYMQTHLCLKKIKSIHRVYEQLHG